MILIAFHCIIGYMKAPQYYVVRKFVLRNVNLLTALSWTARTWIN